MTWRPETKPCHEPIAIVILADRRLRADDAQGRVVPSRGPRLHNGSTTTALVMAASLRFLGLGTVV